MYAFIKDALRTILGSQTSADITRIAASKSCTGSLYTSMPTIPCKHIASISDAAASTVLALDYAIVSFQNTNFAKAFMYIQSSDL